MDYVTIRQQVDALPLQTLKRIAWYAIVEAESQHPRRMFGTMIERLVRGAIVLPAHDAHHNY